MPSWPFSRVASPPISSSRLSVSVSTRETQQLAGRCDVVRREFKEDLFRVVRAGLEDLPQLRVVAVSLRDRLLEDRRVRGHADNGVLVHHPFQLPGLEQVAREEVDPDALA